MSGITSSNILHSDYNNFVAHKMERDASFKTAFAEANGRISHGKPISLHFPPLARAFLQLVPQEFN